MSWIHFGSIFFHHARKIFQNVIDSCSTQQFFDDVIFEIYSDFRTQNQLTVADGELSPSGIVTICNALFSGHLFG